MYFEHEVCCNYIVNQQPRDSR